MVPSCQQKVDLIYNEPNIRCAVRRINSGEVRLVRVTLAMDVDFKGKILEPAALKNASPKPQ